MAITDPNDLTEIKMWVDPLQDVTDSVGKVSDWDDQTAEANDLAQSTSDDQPITDSQTVNGRNVIVFDGSDDYMNVQFGASLEQPYSVFFVAQLNVNTGSNKYIFDSYGGTDRAFMNAKTDTPDNDWNIYAGSQFFNTPSDTDVNWHLIEYDGASSKHYVNGVLSDSGHSGTNDLDGITLGGRYTQADFADIAYGDFGVIDEVLSAGDRGDLDDWGMQKWGLEVTLAPANPAVVAGDEQNTITWDTTHGSTSYNIYWDTSPGVTTGSTKITGETSSYVHTGLSNGTTYYYKIESDNDAGSSALSVEKSGTPASAGSPPTAPTSPLCVIGNAQNTISWVAPADTDSYKLYWDTASPVTTGDNEIVLGAVLSYIHTGRTNGTDYFYAVLAVNEHGEGPLSTEVSGKPIAPPTNLAAVPGSASQENDITWDASAGATSYNLFFSTTPVVTTGDTELSAVTSPYTHTGITNDQIYYYRVEAVNADGDSDLSNEDDATPFGIPVAPTGVSALPNDTFNRIFFGLVAHATSYNIYWKLSSPVTTGDTQILGVTSGYNHTGLSNGTEYFYIVTAVNSRGESPISSEVSAIPAVPPVFESTGGNARVKAVEVANRIWRENMGRN